MPELIIIDQQQLQYENDLLKITVLGGIRLEGLDRLRATLKVGSKVRHGHVQAYSGLIQRYTA